MAHRQPFDLNRPMVAAREFTFAGVAFKKGYPFPTKGFSPRLIKRQYEARVINHLDPVDAAEGDTAGGGAPLPQLTMVGPKGGRYTITGPGLTDPEIVKGKKPAQDRLAELQATLVKPIDGPAALVLVSADDGGTFTVTAPWQKPEIFETAALAEARQAEVRAAGPPEGWEAVPGAPLLV